MSKHVTLVILAVLLSLAGMKPTAASAESPKHSTTPPEVLALWTQRVEELACAEGLRESDRAIAAIVLADLGHYDKAKDIIRRYCSDDWREKALGVVAADQAKAGKLTDAMQTIEEITDEEEREIACRMSASWLAQRGNIAGSVYFLEKLRNPEHQAAARRHLAEAYAKAGDFQAAQDAIDAIPDELSLRRTEATKAVTKVRLGAPEPFLNLPSEFLKTKLQMAQAFRGPQGLVKPSMMAIACCTARTQDLDYWIDKTISSIDAIEPPTTMGEKIDKMIVSYEAAQDYLLLTVALLFADRPDDAKAMLRRYIEATGNEPLNMSGFLGNGVVAYIFTRLGCQKELEQFVQMPDKCFDTTRPKDASLYGGIGAALAEAGEWEAASAMYDSLTDPAQRVQFVTGLISYLPEIINR